MKAPLENPIMPKVGGLWEKRDCKILMDYWPEVTEEGKQKLSDSTESVSTSRKKSFNTNNINE